MEAVHGLFMLGHEPNPAEARVLGYFFYGGLASVAVGLDCAFVFWPTSGGGDAPPTSPVSRSAATCVSVTSGRRTGFGKRP